MGKLIKYSIKWKLCQAKKNRNAREIAYYTDRLKEVAIYMQVKEESKNQKKKFKGKKVVEKSKDFIDPKQLALERQKELIKNITRAEVHVKVLLTKLNIDFEFQYIKFVNEYQFYILDFYLPKYQLCIELDGKHHYENLKQLEHDKIRDTSLSTLNIKTLRFPNNIALKFNKEELQKYIYN